MNRVSRILIATFAVIGAVWWCLSMVPLCYWAVLMLGAGDGAGPSLQLVLLGVAGVILALFLPLLAFLLMFLASLKSLKGGVSRLVYWYVLVILIIVTVILTRASVLAVFILEEYGWDNFHSGRWIVGFCLPAKRQTGAAADRLKRHEALRVRPSCFPTILSINQA
jgi:hypothetical protein